PRCSTLLAMPDDASARRPSLEPGEEEAVHVQQVSLRLPDLPALEEQHGDVMEIPQLGGAGHPLQPVECESNVLVVQGGVEEERGSLLHYGRRQHEVTLDPLASVTNENQVGGLAPHRVSRLGE